LAGSFTIDDEPSEGGVGLTSGGRKRGGKKIPGFEQGGGPFSWREARAIQSVVFPRGLKGARGNKKLG